uniref:Uncharacterized protein n=1 Tax=Candidatus Kentrum sp. LPFa TaxID=2126335 RepID=A0A450WXR1_9GAMM|nr:MAG: hypothetical protein BECKLPF1236B_GA0070989_12752 [Candidatus Kentron sp. LPFa]
MRKFKSFMLPLLMLAALAIPPVVQAADCYDICDGTAGPGPLCEEAGSCNCYELCDLRPGECNENEHCCDWPECTG